MQITKVKKLTLMSCEELTTYAKAMPREYRESILRELIRRDQQQIRTMGDHIHSRDWANPAVHTEPVRHSALYDLP